LPSRPRHPRRTPAFRTWTRSYPNNAMLALIPCDQLHRVDPVDQRTINAFMHWCFSILSALSRELQDLISSNNDPATMSEELQSQWPCPYCFRPFPTPGELRSHLEADRVQPIYLFRDLALTFGSCKISLLKFKRSSSIRLAVHQMYSAAKRLINIQANLLNPQLKFVPPNLSI